jgi:hypothetical protein
MMNQKKARLMQKDLILKFIDGFWLLFSFIQCKAKSGSDS